MSAEGVSRGTEESAETGAVFEVLANRRRRLAVRVLEDASGPLGIGPLATRVAAREHGIDPSEVTHRQRKSAYTALHQNHLPMLADVGIVEAEREWVDVRLTDRAPLVASHLQQELDSGEDAGGGDCSFRSVAVAMGVCTVTPVALSAAAGPLVVATAAATVFLAALAWYGWGTAGSQPAGK
jgi:hypothetical protein